MNNIMIKSFIRNKGETRMDRTLYTEKKNTTRNVDKIKIKSKNNTDERQKQYVKIVIPNAILKREEYDKIAPLTNIIGWKCKKKKIDTLSKSVIEYNFKS